MFKAGHKLSTMPRKQIKLTNLTQLQTEELKTIRRHTPRYENLAKRVFSGRSRGAAVKLACLQCVCWQRNEVRDCTIEGCALWQYRPYQNNEGNGAKDENQTLKL
jgi:hypothetical protein